MFVPIHRITKDVAATNTHDTGVGSRDSRTLSSVLGSSEVLQNPWRSPEHKVHYSLDFLNIFTSG